MFGYRKQIKKDALLLAIQTTKELITVFHKSIQEAERIVKDSKMEKYLLKHPIGLHDSPHKWAIRLLTEERDVETLEKYLL